MSINIRRYEVLFALDTQEQEEGSREAIEHIENALKAEGVRTLKMQHLERRELAYTHKKLKTAYYINFVFEAEPPIIERLRQKFKLNAAIALQQYYLSPLKEKT